MVKRLTWIAAGLFAALALMMTLMNLTGSAHAAASPGVVSFGDSLTWGIGGGSSGGAGTSGPAGHGYEGDSYPVQLAALSGWHVVNQGISGDRVTGGSANDPLNGTDRLQALIPTLPKGTVIVVWMGINDAAASKTASQVVSGYTRMIHDAAAAGDPLFLATLPPSGWSTGTAREVTREQLNNWIRMRSPSQAGLSVTGVIDLESMLANADHRTVQSQYAADGRTVNPNSSAPHLNPKGYAAVARAVYAGVLNPAGPVAQVKY